MTNDEVDAISARAAEHNRAVNVTGMLGYNSRSFIQLLEGDGEDVLAIMCRIETDARHTSITYIRQDNTRTSRECPDWSMRAMIVPLTGAGSANLFTDSLPSTMEMDTKILFTSFASQLNASQAAAHAEAEETLRSSMGPAVND